MRLIDADILFDAMEETEWYNNADRDEIAERLIMDAPSIDIVRCQDCKRAEHEPSGVRCGLSHVLMGEDGFCSIGERKSDADYMDKQNKA